MARVRAALAQDASAIRAVHVAAFPTPAEANLVEQLTADGDATISLVAEDGGEIVGHVILSRMEVEADGRALSGLGLGPVAVKPYHQAQGIGSALIEAAISAARSAETDIVFVVGDPGYYCRFGFDPAAAAAFASPYAGRHFQALPMRGALAVAAGRAEYAPAFAELA